MSFITFIIKLVLTLKEEANWTLKRHLLASLLTVWTKPRKPFHLLVPTLLIRPLSMPNFRNSFIFMLRHDSRENEIHWVFWCKQKFAHLRHQGQDAADLASRPTFWSRKWQPWHGGLFHTTSVLAAEPLLDPSNLSHPGSVQAVEPNLEPDSANRLPHYNWGPRRRNFLGVRALPGLVGPSGEELKEPLKNTQKWRDISPSMALKLKGAPGGSWNALYVLVQLGLIRFSGKLTDLGSCDLRSSHFLL